MANPRANASRAWLDKVKAEKRAAEGLEPEVSLLPLLSDFESMFWNGFSFLNGQRQSNANGGEQALTVSDIHAYIMIVNFDVNEVDIFMAVVAELDSIYLRIMRDHRAEEEAKSKRRGR